MKKVIFSILSIIPFGLLAGTNATPGEAVVSLFVATDQHDWEAVMKVFADEVNLDYSSMSGNPAQVLSPTQIVDSWKGILPGFEFTHHQIGNIMVSGNGDQAHVFCYGTASHFLKDEQGDLWVVVGSYDFNLTRVEKESWKIKSMKFNFKFQDGNTALPQKAIEKLK